MPQNDAKHLGNEEGGRAEGGATPEGQSVTKSLRASCACRELRTTAALATPPGMPSLSPVGQLSAQQMEGVAPCAYSYDGTRVAPPSPWILLRIWET